MSAKFATCLLAVCLSGTAFAWPPSTGVDPQPAPPPAAPDRLCGPTAVGPPAPACPPAESNPGTLYGQRPFGGGEEWCAYAAHDALFPGAPGWKRFVRFQCTPAPIAHITLWGLALVRTDSHVPVQCPLEPGTFEIQFWNSIDDRPDLENPLPNSIYLLTAPDVQKHDSGLRYDAFTLWRWEIALPTPWTQERGWISLRNLDGCAFWWAASPEGNGSHFVQGGPDPLILQPVNADLALCLVGDATAPLLGACCDWNNDPPVCTSNVDIRDCCDPFKTFHPLTTCTSTLCMAGLSAWACCYPVGGVCANTFELYCLSVGGTWLEFRDCGEIPSPCPPAVPCAITCESFSVFSRPLSGPSWLFPSYVENDYSWVDDYSATGNINRVQWWGIGWDGTSAPNHDCDFNGLSDQTVRMRIYPQSYPLTPVYPPTIVYDSLVATMCQTDYWFASITAYIYRFETVISPTLTQLNGWYEIDQYNTINCPMWRLSGTGGNDISYKRIGATFTQWGPSPADPPQDPGACFYTLPAAGACCDQVSGICTNDVLQTNCTGACMIFYRGLSCTGLECGEILGACCRTDGTCDITYDTDCTGGTWLGCYTTCAADCCVVLCPAGGIPEGEPPCGPGYVDTFNAGCNSTPPAWSEVSLGQVICGQAGLYAATPGGPLDRRDTDWYRFTMPALGLLSWHVQAEFAQQTHILTGACDDLDVLATGGFGRCHGQPATAGLEPGEYWLYVAPYADGQPACGTPYNAWLELAPGGSCELAPGHCLITSSEVCLARGGLYYGDGVGGCSCTSDPVWAVRGDANCDQQVNALDINPFVLGLVNLDAWRSAHPQVPAPCEYAILDINCDGAIDALDINPFVRCLVDECPPCP